MKIVPQLADVLRDGAGPQVHALQAARRASLPRRHRLRRRRREVQHRADDGQGAQHRPTGRSGTRSPAVETPDAHDRGACAPRSPSRSCRTRSPTAPARIVSPAAVAKLGEKGVAQNPVGAGPVHARQLQARAGGRPEGLRRVLGRQAGRRAAGLPFIPRPRPASAALRTGAVDVIDAVPVQLVRSCAQEPSVEILRRAEPAPHRPRHQLRREPPCEDVRVRQALNLAVPVETIAERVFFGFAKAPDSPLAFDTAGHKTRRQVRASIRRQGARRCWPRPATSPAPAACWSKDGKPLALTLHRLGRPVPRRRRRRRDRRSASLKQVGVDVDDQQDRARRLFRRAAPGSGEALTWDLADVRLQPVERVRASIISSRCSSRTRDDAARPDVWNIGRYRNEKVDALLRAGQHQRRRAPSDCAASAKRRRSSGRTRPISGCRSTRTSRRSARASTGVELWPIVFTIRVRKAKASRSRRLPAVPRFLARTPRA